MAFDDRIDDAILSLRESLKEAGLFQDGDGQQRIDDLVARVRQTLCAKVIEYCVDSFVDAELDYRAPGNRGVGRNSELIPRYGAYFRRHLKSLDNDELVHLANLIRKQLLTGYLAVALFGEDDGSYEPSIQSSDTLYRCWVPMIYSAKYGDTLTNIVLSCSYHANTQHRAFLTNHGMKGGGLFSRDKTPGILLYYHLAGAALRLAEQLRGTAA